MWIYFVRHGETTHNVERVVQGHLPGELTQRGRSQARCLAKHLKGVAFDSVYCSISKRACDTLVEFLPFTTIKPIYSPLLREKGYGEWEGVHKDIYYEMLCAQGLSKVDYRGSAGESYADLKGRAESFLSELMHQTTEKRVLVVTHAGFIRMALASLTGGDIAEWVDRPLHYASITKVEIDKNFSISQLMIDSNDYLTELI